MRPPIGSRWRPSSRGSGADSSSGSDGGTRSVDDEGDPIVVRDDPDHPDEGFADLYARLPRPQTLEPWLSWAQAARPPVLYLGVGAGRLAVPLAEAGVELVGVDVHPGMLHRLHARRPSMHLVQARIESLDLPERFDLVIAPSGILCTAARARSAVRHLAQAGRVAFELTNPHWLKVAQHPDVRVGQIHQDRAAIEVDYHFADGAVYTQVADVEMIWPERIEGWLSAVGLGLKSLRASVSGPLDESPTYYVEAVSAELSRRSPPVR